jgi:hypothetical protein
LIGAVTADEVNKAIGTVMAWDRAVVLRLVPEAPAAR